ncbi:MAG: hypothetical protein Q9162_001860 [Coniocarpon cinnabarinum]
MDPEARTRQTLDAATRRLQLLELDKPDEEHYSSRWRRKPGAKFHPLWKLIAQISFGIHLLHKEIAKSEEEVIRILQTHVDEIDGFLEDVGADFDLAMRDIDERLRLLLLPLEHGRTFSRMLRDRDFRQSIIDGNDIIERICSRTRLAMDQSLDDVEKGLEATAQLSKFLDRLGKDWPNRDEDMDAIYNAMHGNADGWHCAFSDIQRKGEKLKKMIRRLERIVSEVERQAGIASRRQTRKMQSAVISPKESIAKEQSPVLESKSPPAVVSPVPNSPTPSSWRASLNKPLPPDPHSKRMSKRASHRRQASGSQGGDAMKQPEFSRSPRIAEVKESTNHSFRVSSASPVLRHATKPSFSSYDALQSPRLGELSASTPVQSAIETAREVPLPQSPMGPPDGIPISLPTSPSAFVEPAQVALPMSPTDAAEPSQRPPPQSPSERSVVSQVHRPPTPLLFPTTGRMPLRAAPASPASISSPTQVPLPSSPSDSTVPSQVPLPMSPMDDRAKTQVEAPILMRVDTLSLHQKAVQETAPTIGTPELNAVFNYTPRSPIEAKRASTMAVSANKQSPSSPQATFSREAREAMSPPALTHTGTTASNSSIQFQGERPPVSKGEHELEADTERTLDEKSTQEPEQADRPELEARSDRAPIAELEGNQEAHAAPQNRPHKPLRLNTGVPARVPVGRKASDQRVELPAPTKEAGSNASNEVPIIASAPAQQEEPHHAERTFFSADASDDEEEDEQDEGEGHSDVSALPQSESKIETVETVIPPLRVSSKKSDVHNPDKQSASPDETVQKDERPTSSEDEEIGPMIASFADIRRFSMSSYLDRPRSITSSMSEAHKSTTVERPLSRAPGRDSPSSPKRTVALNAYGPPGLGVMTTGDMEGVNQTASTSLGTRPSNEHSTTPPSPASPLLTESPVTSPRAVTPSRIGGRSPGPYKLIPDIKSPPTRDSGPMSGQTALPQWPKPEPQKKFRKPSISMFKGMLSKKHQKRMGSGGLGGHVAMA